MRERVANVRLPMFDFVFFGVFGACCYYWGRWSQRREDGYAVRQEWK